MVRKRSKKSGDAASAVPEKKQSAGVAKTRLPPARAFPTKMKTPKPETTAPAPTTTDLHPKKDAKAENNGAKANGKKQLKKKVKKEEVVDEDEKEEKPSTATDSSSTTEDAIRVLRYSLGGDYTCERHLFLKADASNTYSLLVGNVPAYLDLDAVKGFLESYASERILQILPQRSNAPGDRMDAGQLTISVVFPSAAGVTSALKGAEKAGPFIASNYASPAFDDTDIIQSMITSYAAQFVPKEQLMAKAESFLAEHDAVRIAEERASRKRRQAPDEEGWVTVKKGARKGVPDAKKVKQGEYVPPSGALDTDKKKKKDDVAFYNFQIKESRMKHLNDLRARFEEDKKRVALAKAARKFRPL